MNLIVLDLEWNGAYSKRLKGFMNEIIEFGAVKVDEELHVLDTFEALIRPQVGKKISGKIRTLTSITNEDLERGLQFMQVVSRFGKWAGRSVLMTWGTSDILALIENYRYFSGGRRLPFLSRYVDLQEYCERLLDYDRTKQMGLSTAAKLLEINEEGFDHHRALGDSLLSLTCLQRLYVPGSLEPFIQQADSDAFYDRMEFRTAVICDLNHPLIRPSDMTFVCDLCGHRARRISEWQLRNGNFRALFLCRQCNHKFYGRVQFKLKYDGMTVKKKVLPFNAEKEQKEDGQAQGEGI